MSRERAIRSYLRAMEQGDLTAVLACFTADGIVVSPTYGEMPVRPFYEKLLADTLSASVSLQGVYRAVGMPERWAAHFAYVWIRRNQTATDTHLIDLFEFQPRRNLISRLTIVFDNTSPKRETAFPETN